MCRLKANKKTTIFLCFCSVQSKEDPAAAKLAKKLDEKSGDQQAPVGRSNIPAVADKQPASMASSADKRQVRTPF